MGFNSSSNTAGLHGKADKDVLIAAIKEADKECGSYGCDFDPLYRKALELL